MSKLQGEVLTLPKMSGSVSTPKSLSGNVGAKTVNIGEDGATFVPSVSADGVISWTNDKDLPNPEPVNIKGVKGDKGDQGERGLQGIQGIQGERGEQGLKGDKGDKGDTGANGKDGADGKNGKDGYTPIKGFDYFDGKDGVDGVDGADGYSPTVSVGDISGGHRVTITDKDGEKTFDVMDGEGGSGGGAAIIDVVELPTENINEDVFYRLLTGTFVYNQYTHNGFTCYCVNGLPETGEPATNADMSTVVAYYNTQDGELYGYVDVMLSQFFRIPIGWYPASMLFQAAGLSYNGVITDILDDPKDGTFRVLLEYALYSYKDGKWTSNKTIGWSGDGASAEVFNHPSNKASGDCSHAEGYRSHAVGRSQHVQGEYNAIDPQYNPDGHNVRAKYAHIVGNGTYTTPSNAHTLDWNGLGWFAGGLKVGGDGQDDPNAEEILTKSQVQALIDAAIAKLNL